MNDLVLLVIFYSIFNGSKTPVQKIKLKQRRSMGNKEAPIMEDSLYLLTTIDAYFDFLRMSVYLAHHLMIEHCYVLGFLELFLRA